MALHAPTAEFGGVELSEPRWDLDQLVACCGRVSGASSGGHAGWIQFSLEVDELASLARELGFETVRVACGVFEQFLAYPVDGIWLAEGEPLLGSESGEILNGRDDVTSGHVSDRLPVLRTSRRST